MKNRKKTYKKKIKKNKTKKRIGGEILGNGIQGCIVDSIKCGHYTKENGFVAKLLKKDEYDNEREIRQETIQMKLSVIDPNEERFALYHKENCDISKNKDVKKCEKLLGYGIDTDNIFFTKKLDSINPLELTKFQWRHLRDSVSLLRKIGIIHGDLPNNIMLNPDTKMPVIIDWDSSILMNYSYDEPTLAMDYNAFMNPYFFSVKR